MTLSERNQKAEECNNLVRSANDKVNNMICAFADMIKGGSVSNSDLEEIQIRIQLILATRHVALDLKEMVDFYDRFHQ